LCALWDGLGDRWVLRSGWTPVDGPGLSLTSCPDADGMCLLMAKPAIGRFDGT
jgi:hypothetical protein